MDKFLLLLFCSVQQRLQNYTTHDGLSNCCKPVQIYHDCHTSESIARTLDPTMRLDLSVLQICCRHIGRAIQDSWITVVSKDRFMALWIC